jgi:hypothetical protein
LVVFGQLLQDREHHVLLAQVARVLDLQLLGKGEKVGGGFALKFLEIHCKVRVWGTRGWGNG